MIHVFNYKDKNYIYDVGSGSLHECDKKTADQKGSKGVTVVPLLCHIAVSFPEK